MLDQKPTLGYAKTRPPKWDVWDIAFFVVFAVMVASGIASIAISTGIF